MLQFLRFSLLLGVKLYSHLFYKLNKSWIAPPSETAWKKVRLLIFLNHTSLYEPLFVSAAPLQLLWRSAAKLVIPVAQKTLIRPLVGPFMKMLAPHAISISRHRDATWDHFLHCIDKDSIIVIFPEGRMKRPTGLDLNGKPMNVKGGVADIISLLKQGKMIIAYSGGLHHVQVPGQKIPHLFKTIDIKFEEINIEDYIAEIKKTKNDFRQTVMRDLDNRMKIHCPPSRYKYPHLN